MKQLKLSAIYLFAMVVGLSSCLKENDRTIIDESKGANIIEFANTGTNAAGGTASKYPRFATDMGVVEPGQVVKFNVNISYSGTNPAPQDITVNFDVDQAVLDVFNEQNGTHYEIPPADVFTIPTKTAVIPAGQRRTTVEVAVNNTPNFDFGKNYAIPLKITSSSHGTVSGNFGAAVYSFAARNNYDGVYTVTPIVPFKDVNNANFVGYYPLTIELRTFTGNSVVFYDEELLGGEGHIFDTDGTGALSYYGSFSPVFFFHEDGTIYDITNVYGQFSGASKRSAVLDPSGANKVTFNPDGTVKEIEVAYIMAQGDAKTPRTYFHEKFVRTGARP